jgi:membrane-bound ClpP family serine protease
MKEKYTTEKAAGKFKKLSYLGILLLVIGILLLFTENYADIGVFQLIGTIADKVIMLLAGTFMYVFFTKRSKLLSENYFEIDENTLAIKTNNKSILFDLENKPKSIKVNLKTISVISNDNIDFELILDDYSNEYKVKKRIKEQIEALKIKYYA